MFCLCPVSAEGDESAAGHRDEDRTPRKSVVRTTIGSNHRSPSLYSPSRVCLCASIRITIHTQALHGSLLHTIGMHESKRRGSV